MTSASPFEVYLRHVTWSNALLSVAVAIPVILLLNSLFSKHSLRHIPVVGGPSLPVLSYLGAFRFNKDGKAVLEEGCRKYRGRVFKVAMFDQWLCVANGIPLNDEIQKIPDEQANFIYGVGELVGTRYIFRPDIIKQPYHVSLIRTQLTRSIAAQFENIHDEIDKCFKEMIPSTEWTSVSAIMVLRQMVARVSSRVFVGAPLCYDPKYLYASTQFTIDFTDTRTVLNRFPVWTKPYVVAWLAGIKDRVKEGLEVIGPVIDERMRLAEKYGKDWEDKPNDMLQWIIDGALARGHTKWNMVERILLVNFTAIFTSSSSLSHAVHQLAAQPEFIAPLREEIERVVAEDGWTKAAMQKMRKLDSFMRENQRYNTINIGALTRQIRRDITLEDGTYLPKGTLLVTSSFATHFDSETYPDPYVFKPWRYVDMRDDEEDGNLKYHFATTSLDYIVFGHGKHSCPGRFFAVNELKAVMAYVIMHYDLKFADEGKEPKKPVIFMSILPDPKVEVLFKRRA